MATNHTENYALNLWTPQDSFLREEFNENTEKIDAALGGKGNCTIVTGSYVGTGEYGAGHPTTLTFPGKPLFVGVHNGGYLYMIYGSPVTYGVSTSGSTTYFGLTWSDNSVSWFSNYDAGRQLNTAGTTFHYIALIAA